MNTTNNHNSPPGFFHTYVIIYVIYIRIYKIAYFENLRITLFLFSVHNMICYFLSIVHIVITYTLYIVIICNYQSVSLSSIRFYLFMIQIIPFLFSAHNSLAVCLFMSHIVITCTLYSVIFCNYHQIRLYIY